jgi:hypothetical protein
LVYLLAYEYISWLFSFLTLFLLLLVMSKRVSKGKVMKRRSRKRRGAGVNPAGDSAIIPWNSNMAMTDSFKLPTLPSSVLHQIQVVNFPGFLAQSSSVPVTNAFTVSANLFTGFAHAAALFDQYRIVGIEVYFNPQTTEGIPTTTIGPPKGLLRTVLDFDDGNALTSAGNAEAYSTCISTEVVKPQRRSYQPRCAQAAYSGTFAGFSNVPAPWIDAASNTVQHYGLKFWIDAGTTGNTVAYDIVCRAYFQFRSTR